MSNTLTNRPVAPAPPPPTATAPVDGGHLTLPRGSRKLDRVAGRDGGPLSGCPLRCEQRPLLRRAARGETVIFRGGNRRAGYFFFCLVGAFSCSRHDLFFSLAFLWVELETSSSTPMTILGPVHRRRGRGIPKQSRLWPATEGRQVFSVFFRARRGGPHLAVSKVVPRVVSPLVPAIGELVPRLLLVDLPTKHYNDRLSRVHSIITL